MYSKDTCCWLSVYEQNQLVDFVQAHSHEMKKFILVHPDGTEEICTGLKNTCRKYNLCPQSVNVSLKNNWKHKGYRFKYIK